jgi:hypothetical protein
MSGWTLKSAADEVLEDRFMSEDKLLIPDVCKVRPTARPMWKLTQVDVQNENGSSKKNIERKQQNDFAMAQSKSTTRNPAKHEHVPQRGKRPVDIGRLLEPLPERPRAFLPLRACEVHQVEPGKPGVHHVVRDVLQER